MTPNPENLPIGKFGSGGLSGPSLTASTANLRATVFETCQLASSPAEAPEEATVAAAFPELANWQVRVGWTVRTLFDCLDG